MTEQRKLRPREAEALRVWDDMPDPTYAKVAGAMDITQGRAAVYVREALRLSGRIDEAPRGGNGHGATEPQTPRAMIEAAIVQTRANIEAQETKVNAAREAADTFDADQWRKDQADALKQQIKDLQTRVKAWESDEDGAATQAAEAEAERLTTRADKVQGDTEQQTEKLRTSLTGYEQALEALSAAA